MTTNLSSLGSPSLGVSKPLNSDSSQIANSPIVPFVPSVFAPFDFLPAEITVHVLSFLGEQELRVVDAVSHLFRPSVDTACRMRCQNKGFVPEHLPPEVNYKQFLFNRFPNAIGVDFYQEHLGDVDIVPVPIHFIEMAPRPGFKLVFIPEYITIDVDENSPLMLDETTAINGKKARLIEAADRAPRGQTGKIQVPVTPNNIILLFQNCLKKNLLPQFAGITGSSWPNVLDQHGDIGVGPSHWSYQKEAVIGLGKTYHSRPDGVKGQVEVARDEGLEIVPLGDRILFHLSSCIKSGKFPQKTYIERTSTAFQDNGGNSRQSVIWWWAIGPVFRLDLYSTSDFSDVGAAVRFPVGNSQAIGQSPV
jgi:hypothetical protein